MQSSKPDAIVVVTTPQDLAREIVEKGVNMAINLGLNEIHLIENMSYFQCPNCGHVSYIFGKNKVSDLTLKYGLNAEAKIPINPKISELGDLGRIEEMDVGYFDGMNI
jgi:Mrp family chromosome partitioning ATPase